MKWSRWHQLDDGCVSGSYVDGYGVYRIRLVDRMGRPIPVDRIACTDKSGIVYIGRSGFKKQRTGRTISRRVWEFYQGYHSGGDTYYLSTHHRLRLADKYKSHRIEVSVATLPDAEISKGEADTLYLYFRAFGELPPFNSSFPNQLKAELRKGVY